MRETIAAISNRVISRFDLDAKDDANDFPIIFTATFSKQNILCSAVPSDAMKLSLYLIVSM